MPPPAPPPPPPSVAMRRAAQLASTRASLRALLALVVASVLLVPTAPGTASKSYSGWRVLRVAPANAAQLRALERGLERLESGAVEVWRRRPFVDVLVRPDVFKDLMRFLNVQGVRAVVHVSDVGEAIRQERSTETFRSGSDSPDLLQQYLRYGEINDYLAELAERHPQLVTVETFGNSYEGRPMKVIKISSGGFGQRPVILIDAGIHAREWIAPSMALYIIQQLVENPANADLIANVDWHIIPILNPDGYEHSHTSDRMWRKTRSRTDSPFCLGADPNRNFDHQWGVVGVSWDPCKETYAGPSPFSEVEAEALAAYGLALRRRMRLYVSVHSYGGLFIHPWGYSYQKPDDSPDMVALGTMVAAAVKAAGIQHFQVGNCFETLGELAAGGSDDWMKAVVGVNFSYTLEMPVPSFTTPASDIELYVIPTFEGFRTMGRFISDRFGCC